MSHILIDARLYGPKHTGLGRYTKNLLVALKKLPDFKKHRFSLLVYPELLSEIKNDLGSSFAYYPTSLRHYSLKEQIFLPFLIKKISPDLTHFTHLDKPILFNQLSLVTVHDLIRHFSKGKDTSTHSSLLYWPKYLGYLLMTKTILNNSYLIVPSNYWRDYIINHYRFNPQKIVTTYEAVDPNFLAPANYRAKTPQNYLLYNGNLYPHKNIIVILEALTKIPTLKLKIICARPIFKEKLDQNIQKLGLQKQVEFLGYLPDKDFTSLYQNALALVHPSFLEGFSLTGLEAMALNCPVIAAKASCLPEIYGDSVLYFNPKSSSSLCQKIKKLQKSLKLRKELISRGQNQIKKYSWTKTACETFAFYNQILDEKNS